MKTEQQGINFVGALVMYHTVYFLQTNIITFIAQNIFLTFLHTIFSTNTGCPMLGTNCYGAQTCFLWNNF